MTDTRLWLFLDELESLGKLESFVPAATKGRKHGLRIVGSIQDWAQLDETYGKDSAKTLLACFRNYLIFGASNAFNADKASEILGKQHVERIQITNTVGRGGGGSRQLVAYPQRATAIEITAQTAKPVQQPSPASEVSTATTSSKAPKRRARRSDHADRTADLFADAAPDTSN
ncbi:Type IV secretion-system coupling protein DNA-binding domain-containing protein [Variovorax sp. YR216]|nr:Type IV secretion-system coupling protein DNA-binding domain-containing protein [Variovorax sp. YR216]